MPSERRQFRVLYRDFLIRMMDLEILSSNGDMTRVLVQFTAMLAAFSLTFAMASVSKYVGSTLPHDVIVLKARPEEEFLIAATMAIAGMFSVLAWNTILPARRDCLVLGVLPVRLRTIFAAKVAALGTALAISVAAVNLFTGLYTPFIAAPAGASVLTSLRFFGAYWITLFAAGAFVCGGLLALQGLAAQLLSYRLFLRVSSYLQLAAFFGILGLFFLKPPFPNPKVDAWMPSFWFFGLFQSLSGNSEFAALAARAAEGLAIVFAVATLTFALAYGRSIRKIVEQPDIAPADRTRSASRLGTWLARRLFPRAIDRAIVLFTARGMARSRQHRLLLAVYMGIGLAIGLAYAREYVYGPSSFEAIASYRPWNQPNVPFLAGSLVLLFFALIGTRAVFAMPIALPANWVFRVTAVHSPAAYFRAVRKSLFTLAGLPVWIGAAVLFFTVWPAFSALEHLALMAAIGILVIEKSLRAFRKIPFACSYLPGKARLHIRLGAFGAGFLFLADQGVHLEFWSMGAILRFAILFGIVLAAALWARRNTLQSAASKSAALQFEDLDRPDVDVLDLRRDGAWSKEDSYIDHIDPGDPPPTGGSGLGDAGLIGLGIGAGLAASREPPPPLRVRIEQAFGDLRHGARILVKAPGFSAAAVLLVAMGIGGNATIYSLVHGILGRPAPGVHARGLVSMGVSVDGRMDEPGFSYLELTQFAEARTIRSYAACAGARYEMDTRDGGRYQLRGQAINGDYFSTLEVPMALGRSFTKEELRGEAPLTAILAYHVWENQFGKAADILGQVVQLNGAPATIVGVSARGFQGASLAPNYEIAVPLTPPADGRQRRNLLLIGKLMPGASLAAAQSEFDAISRRLQDLDPENERGHRVLLARHTATAFGPNSGPQPRLFMTLLSAVALLTLLVVCANVANLMLARAVTRRREMAVRLSMGAGRWRILRILFAEGLAISLVAAAAALLFTEWATRGLVRWLPPVESGARFEANLSPDWQVSFYALLLAVGGTLVFTLAPAVQAWRQDLLPWLKSGEQCVVQGRNRLANLLVVVQIALCFVLLIGAAMMRQSVDLISAHDLYFNKDHLLLVGVDTRNAAAGPEQNAALLERLRRRLQATPGVAAASYGVAAPPHAATGLRVVAGQTTATADGNYVGPAYLETLGVPILTGSDFDAHLERGPVALVNQKLAAALWPGQNPVGRPLQVDDLPAQVIGVVPNGAFSGIGSGGAMAGLTQANRGNFLFIGGIQSPPGGRTLHVRYTGALAAVTQAVRAAIREGDPRVPTLTIRTLASDWSDFTSPVRFISALLQVFAVGSLVLAAIGLYAVASFYTARRTREFGIRMALGASPPRMQRSVLREAGTLAAAGIAIGAALSIAARKALSGLIAGLGSAEVASWLTAILLLAAVSLLAAWLPARRAARTDPMAALRME